MPHTTNTSSHALSRKSILGPEIRRRWRTATAAIRQFPHVLVLGSPESGADLLESLLRQHPGCVIGSPPTDRATGLSPRSADFLARFPLRFRVWEARGCCCDIWPSGLHQLQAVRSLASESPELRLIVAVRAPAERAWRQYQRLFAPGAECPSFNELVQATLSPGGDGLTTDRAEIIRQGYYDRAVMRLHQILPPSQVLVVDVDELLANSREVHRLLAHIGLDYFRLTTSSVALERDASLPTNCYDQAALSLLRRHYTPHNAALARLTGRPIFGSTDGAAQRAA